MDVLTEKGRETLQQVADAVNIWRSNFPDLHYIHTPANKPADLDGIIVRSGTVKGVVEVKCRVSMTLDAFQDNYNSEWLVTFDKIMRCIKVADAVQAPFLGFLYFPHEKTLLYKVIYRPDRGMQAKMRVENTITQATVNGGKKSRDNAYIDMSGAERLT